jgi:feruloyl esterase
MAKRMVFALMILSAIGAANGETARDGRQACAEIKKLSFDSAKIVESTPVEAGALVLEHSDGDSVFKKLPAFCRVVAISKPSADSNIRIEVWLPLKNWNGKFNGQGNGGFAGSISYHGLAVAVRSGFASGGTDAGHTGGATDSAWALGHPEKVIDFGYRGVHLMTEFSKKVVEAFYSTAAKHSYFTSCSDGGREALMEAQRFPADYDGILAGAPAYNWTSLLSRATEMTKMLLSSPESYLPASKIPALSKAVLAACRKDEPGPFLADPRSCHFSPDALVCKGAETDQCLTQAQANSVKALYANSYTSDGKLVYHGLLPGAEEGNNGWQGWITGKSRNSSEGAAYGEGYFRNLVYSNPRWELKSFELDRDLKAAEETTGKALNAVNPDLQAFGARGGKLILYHGWDDPAISALGTIDYYNDVVKTLGQNETSSFVRLFMAPGMQHCEGGPGLTEFGQWEPALDPALNDAAHNITTALQVWVETGKAPEQVIARGGSGGVAKEKASAFAEPLCAYPRAAQYKGSGDQSDAANYTCGSE